MSHASEETPLAATPQQAAPGDTPALPGPAWWHEERAAELLAGLTPGSPDERDHVMAAGALAHAQLATSLRLADLRNSVDDHAQRLAP